VAQTIEAACNGDIKIIQTLIRQDTRLINVQSKEIKSTPLHFSAHRGYLDIVKLLLDAGADVNAEEGNYSASTPLHWAASGGHLEVVKFLVENGAKLDVKGNWNNLTPFGWATIIRYEHGDCPMGDRHQEICSYLLERGAEFDLFSGIALNNLEWVSAIANNLEVLQQKLGFALGGLQPLHYAIQENKTEIAKLLIDRGADLQAQSYFGITPLCMAIQQGDRQIVELLEDCGVPKDLGSLLALEQWSEAEDAIA